MQTAIELVELARGGLVNRIASYEKHNQPSERAKSMLEDIDKLLSDLRAQDSKFRGEGHEFRADVEIRLTPSFCIRAADDDVAYQLAQRVLRYNAPDYQGCDSTADLQDVYEDLMDD